MASLILKRTSSGMNKLLFHNPLLRSSAAASATTTTTAPPSDRLIAASRVSDISQMRGGLFGIIKSNPITNTTSQLWNDAKQLHTLTTTPTGLAPVSAAATASIGGGIAARRYSTKSVRPLSPHLSVYKPQSSSMGSIFHRISFLYIAGLITFYYLMYIKMGVICLTYDSFNSVLFYTSQLNSILAELAGVAMIYYVYHGVNEFLQFRSGGVKTGLIKMLRFGKK